jgi:hypothetical protein
MVNLFHKLASDEAGFIVSAELILVATIGVLSMVVGLSELAGNVNQELEDLGSVNQSFEYSLPHSHGKSCISGSRYHDKADYCDEDCDLQMGDSQGEH